MAIFACRDFCSCTCFASAVLQGPSVIHFGMAVKEAETAFSIWLDKFEAFFKTMPGAIEAMVILGSETFRTQHGSGRFIYQWKRKYGAADQPDVWEFSADEHDLFQ